jgi:hypothetical protein
MASALAARLDFSGLIHALVVQRNPLRSPVELASRFWLQDTNLNRTRR